MKTLKLEKLNTFKNNGENSLSSKSLFDKKSEERFKLTILLKSFFLIILTNLITYILFSKNDSKYVITPPYKLGGYNEVRISLINYAPITQPPKEITIYGANNKRIINKAYLISKLDTELNHENQAIYLVAIRDEDIKKIVRNKRATFYSFPYFKKTKLKKLKIGEPYEIIF